MKKITTVLAALLMASSSMFATELSEYCDYPTGHENNAEFGDASGLVLLTISKQSDNELAVTIKERSDATVIIDFLEVVAYVDGDYYSFTCGTDEGTVLSEYKAIVTFDTMPENITLSSIYWSTTGWDGRWALWNLVVPFDAVCDYDYNDDVKPVMGTASVVSTTYSSITLGLDATDTDNDGVANTITDYVITDTANGITNSVVEANSNGEVTITGLNPATTYNFTIAAMDNAGNISDNTTTVTATTDELDELCIIDTFEDGTLRWEASEGSNDLYVVANPYIDGVNTSEYVLQGGRNTDANFWAAAMIRDIYLPGGLYNYLHVMMYRNTIGSVPKAKLSDTYSTEFEPISGQQTMVAGEWQDVVFDISGTFVSGTTIDFLYFMYDIGTLTENAVVYLDDVLLSNDMTPRVSSSAIKEVTTTESNAYAANGSIYVKSAQAEEIAIYTLTGSCVATSKAVESAEFALPSGCYLVKVGNKVSKVIL